MSPSDAEAHSSRALVLRYNGDFEEAVREFENAAALRPRYYVFWYEVALTRDSVGADNGAIAACEQSVRLAPFYGRPRWLLGNLYFRAGRPDEAFIELRRAASSIPEFLPGIIDLAWGASHGDARSVLNLIQPENESARVTLAHYFAKKGQYGEAVSMFRAAGTASEEERKKLLAALLNAHQFKEAYEVWSINRQENKRQPSSGINTLTDPGFEETIRLSEPGFGWQQPGPVENVNVTLDANNPRNGGRSLLIEFNGNSNPLSPIISQLVLVEPGMRYELRLAARTEKIVTGGLPQITVSEASGAGDPRLLASLTLPAESGSWRDYSISFNTSQTAQAIIINVNRQSCSDNPCPAFGREWLDDLSLQKQAQP